MSTRQMVGASVLVVTRNEDAAQMCKQLESALRSLMAFFEKEGLLVDDPLIDVYNEDDPNERFVQKPGPGRGVGGDLAKGRREGAGCSAGAGDAVGMVGEEPQTGFSRGLHDPAERPVPVAVR